MTTSFQLFFPGLHVCNDPKLWKVFLFFAKTAQGNNCLNETCFDDA